tara:strand:+ start:3780 stop:4241 length:462 start_codon:yes stop_codon:yes gene_type:complete
MSKERKFPESPILAVSVVVLKDDMILLVKRGKDPFKNQWSLPGGKQKLAETVVEAVKRELNEETGIKVDKVSLFDVTDIILTDDEDKIIFHYTVLNYKANWLSGECNPGSDSKTAKWFKLNQMYKLKLSKKITNIISKVCGKKYFSYAEKFKN